MMIVDVHLHLAYPRFVATTRSRLGQLELSVTRSGGAGQSKGIVPCLVTGRSCQASAANVVYTKAGFVELSRHLSLP